MLHCFSVVASLPGRTVRIYATKGIQGFLGETTLVNVQNTHGIGRGSLNRPYSLSFDLAASSRIM